MTTETRERADEFEEKVIAPLRTARDHCHWLAIHRHRSAAMLEAVLDAALRMSYEIKGRLARGES